MPSSREPVVCTLGATDAAARVLEWADLSHMAQRTTPLANGARMVFPLKWAARVAELAEREADCCRFLTITTSADDEHFVVEITADDPAATSVIVELSGVAGL